MSRAPMEPVDWGVLAFIVAVFVAGMVVGGLVAWLI